MWDDFRRGRHQRQESPAGRAHASEKAIRGPIRLYTMPTACRRSGAAVSLFETPPSEFEHCAPAGPACRPLHRTPGMPRPLAPPATAAVPPRLTLAPMKGTTVRNLAILEPLLVYAMILAYIWNWR